MAVENFEEFLSEFRGDDLSYALKQLELLYLVQNQIR